MGRLTDDPSHWPANCTIELTGFAYQRITQRSTDVAPCPLEERLAWIREYAITNPTLLDRRTPEHGEFSPAPYEQLSAALRKDGYERQARQVSRYAERHRHRAMGPIGGIWGAIQDVTVGFGYQPARALAWLIGLLVAGTAYFVLAGQPDAIKPGETPAWDPFLYTLGLIVPLGDLGQAKAWNPTGWSKGIALILMIPGWILGTAVVAGISRVLKRQ